MNSVEKKVINLEELSEQSNDSVVLCHGHFNIIHPGHIRYLEYASHQGERLVVSIEGDSSFFNPEGKHFFNEVERATGVASIQTVDQVVILSNGRLEDLIKVLNPAILVLGKEFEYQQEEDDQINKAVEQLKKQGGQVLFHAGEIHYASADLLLDNQADPHEQQTKLFNQACKQQNIKSDELLKCIDKFKNT